MVRMINEPDFSEIKNQKFQCVENCASCCYHQAVLVTTNDINVISAYIKKEPHKLLKSYANACQRYNHRPILSDEEIEEFRNTFQTGWANPHEAIKTNSGSHIVMKYMIQSMPSTGRCIFLDPISKYCFIYPVRPFICRIYPIVHRLEQNVQKFYLDEECKGIGRGNPIKTDNLQEELEKFLAQSQNDLQIVKKYIDNKGISMESDVEKRTDMLTEEKLGTSENKWQEMYYGKKHQEQCVNLFSKELIEPLVELKIMPQCGLRKMINGVK